jgi:hypothetical protein
MLILFFVGMLIAVRAVLHFARQKRTRNWIPVDITITRSEIDLVEKPEIYAKIEYFFPLVEYSYEVDGLAYKSDKVSLDSKAWVLKSRSEVEKAFERAISRKKAYLNPVDYREAVLIREIPKERRMHYVGVLMAGLLVSIVALSLLVFLT